MRSRPLHLAAVGLFGVAVLVYAAELTAGGMAVCERLGFVPADPSLGTALSSMWLHDPEHPGHLLGNLFVLGILGALLEPTLGGRRLLALFVASGLGGAMMHRLVAPDSEAPLVGMSGALAGLMAVVAVARPRLMLAFVVSYIAINLVGLYVDTPLVPPSVSVACHIGGFVSGSLFVGAGRIRGIRWATVGRSRAER